MAYYLDGQHYLDLAYCVAAFPCAGDEDDTYAIHAVLHVGHTAVPMLLSYSSAAERDAALETLLRLLRETLDEEEDAPIDWDEEGKDLGAH